ncbi:MAG: hypothetical protein ACLRZT_04470 [Clostridium paraputrificum]
MVKSNYHIKYQFRLYSFLLHGVHKGGIFGIRINEIKSAEAKADEMIKEATLRFKEIVQKLRRSRTKSNEVIRCKRRM